jgi:chromosome segregation ATPase
MGVAKNLEIMVSKLQRESNDTNTKHANLKEDYDKLRTSLKSYLKSLVTSQKKVIEMKKELKEANEAFYRLKEKEALA